MYRRGGILLLTASTAFLVWSLAISSVSMDVGYDWDEDRNVQVKTQECGPAIPVVLGNLDPSVPGFRTAQDCRTSAWARIVFNGLLGLIGAGIGVWAIRRGGHIPNAPSEALRSLPSTSGELRAKQDLGQDVNDR
ncbi:MAG: hypothetical protein OEO77_00830 [Acidimicrobiia bacterium]|nr:hypothetical protein [Acidimicrobiia bacterium]